MKNYFIHVIFFLALLILCSGCASSPSSKIGNALSLDETEQAEKTRKHDAAMPLIKEALALANKGNHDQAIEKFMLAQQIIPIPLISHAIGVSYCRKKDYEKGLFYFYEALLLYGSSKQEEIDQGLLMKLIYHIDEAESALISKELEEKSGEMITDSIKGTFEQI